MLRTESIKTFLKNSTLDDLASLYNHDMECQVNVARDNGERVEGDYNGVKWHGWTDGMTTWKNIRIPRKANSNPEFNDSKMTFDLAKHAEAIGMTGWDWKNRVSKWVAFDFDAMVGHSDSHNKKLSAEELSEITESCRSIPWVTVRKSTSGNGLHLYVFLDDVPTKNHNEHAALARAILGMMSGLTGHDYCSKVDICGGIMWVWHRKMKGTDGLTLIKEGGVLTEVPPNWKEHVKVVSGKRTKTLPNFANGASKDPFESLIARKVQIDIDEEHKRHMNWLKNHDCVWWFDQDQHMLVTHTAHLRQMHRDLDLIGFFDTITTHSSPQNCFLFPMRNGAWAVRRYSIGVNEHPSWEQDGDGWTKCYFNKQPTLGSACKAMGGIEDEKGAFMFREAEMALQAARLLGVIVNIDPHLVNRSATIKMHKDSKRIVISIDHDEKDIIQGDSKMRDWIIAKKKYTKIYSFANSSNVIEPDSNNYDDMIRHLVSETNQDAGWVMNNDGEWHIEPKDHIKLALQSCGLSNSEINNAMGSAIMNCWRLINRPFKDEYPGDRQWNRDAAKLRFTPSDATDTLNFPTWQKILDHCGAGIDGDVSRHEWCQANGILTGADYLKYWVASLFQHPEKHLPYLFFYSIDENTGKSSFHESISLLFTKGYIKANHALTSKNGFNGELSGAVLCAVEEEDLSKGAVHNKIKDWVTGREIAIRAMQKQTVNQLNTTHWVQCANNPAYCPMFKGDTRITMIRVAPIEPVNMIPAGILHDRLIKEAPDFLAEIMNIDLPASGDRLNLPVINTSEKALVQSMNRTDLEHFLDEYCEPCDGAVLTIAEFHSRFLTWLDPNAHSNWSKIMVGKKMPLIYPKGRYNGANWYFGNIKWKDDALKQPSKKLFTDGEYLREVE